MKTKTLFSSIVGSMLLVTLTTNLTFSQQSASSTSSSVFEIKEIPLQKALVVKAEVPMKEIGPKMGELFGKLFSYAGINKIQLTGAPFAVYYSFDPQGTTVFETCFPVSSKVNAGDSIVYKEFPAMKVVSTLYKGTYESMMPVYTQMQEYITKNNLKANGTSWEVYLKGPHQVKDPNEYQTIIYFPIE
jgi:AraC family transcriptional regulator